MGGSLLPTTKTDSLVSIYLERPIEMDLLCRLRQMGVAVLDSIERGEEMGYGIIISLVLYFGMIFVSQAIATRIKSRGAIWDVIMERSQKRTRQLCLDNENLE
jgi:hypothetical protein